MPEIIRVQGFEHPNGLVAFLIESGRLFHMVAVWFGVGGSGMDRK